MLSIDISHAASFLSLPYEAALRPRLERAAGWLQNGGGKGSDFIGWVTLPRDYDRGEYARILAAAKKIQGDSKALVVIGIGGSYLGARGVIECLCSPNYNLKKKSTPNIYFIGNGLSSDALREVTALKSLADQEGYEEFVVPDNIGGRYSVLTAVGLLPIAVAGVDLNELMGGAQEMMTLCAKNDYSNPAWQYAAMRHELYRQGKKVELLACFEPAFRFMAEWWKQLYGESEGKEEKGLFPASVDFTADLHSMGQYIQQGERMLMETVVRFAPAEQQMVVPFDEANGDGLNFLAGKTMDFINRQAMDGTLLAHVEGGVPNIILNLDENNARTMGQLIYFFEYACGLSGYLLGVNPFDQPGVEAYKKNMFALLGKPGYEEMGEELRKRLR